MVAQFVINSVLILLFLASGMAVQRFVYPAGRFSGLYDLANAFFFGLMCFVTAWVAFGLSFASAERGIILAGCLLALLSVMGATAFLRACKRVMWGDALPLIGLLLIILVFHLYTFRAGYGHLEEFYLQIASYVFSHDVIPILGLHYGQSLLGVAGGKLFGMAPTIFSCNLWLPVTMFFLAILLREVLASRGFGPWASFGGTVCLLLWNPALSLADVMFFSTGNPLLFIAYPDDIISLAVLFQLFTISVSYLLSDGFARPSAWFVPPLLFSVSLNIVAPHDIIVVCFFLLFLGLDKLRGGLGGLASASGRRFALFAVVFVALLAVGTRFGGPYSPLSSQTRELKLPTLSIEENAFHLFPGFSYLIKGPATQNIYYEKIEDVSLNNPSLMLWHIENAILKLLKVLFFPTVGLILVLRRDDIGVYPDDGNGWNRGDAVFAVSSFAILAILFCISYGTFDKFGFTKLLFPYYVFGLVYFLQFMAGEWAGCRSRARKVVWIAIMVFPSLSAYEHFRMLLSNTFR